MALHKYLYIDGSFRSSRKEQSYFLRFISIARVTDYNNRHRLSPINAHEINLNEYEEVF